MALLGHGSGDWSPHRGWKGTFLPENPTLGRRLGVDPLCPWDRPPAHPNGGHEEYPRDGVDRRASTDLQAKSASGAPATHPSPLGLKHLGLFSRLFGGKRSAPAETSPVMVSLVVLLRQAVRLDRTALREKLDAVFPGQF